MGHTNTQPLHVQEQLDKRAAVTGTTWRPQSPGRDETCPTARAASMFSVETVLQYNVAVACTAIYCLW